MAGLVIAIDGPSGVGKSSKSRAVAERLRLGCLDTGSMYRAIALGCMAGGIIGDAEAVIGFTQRAQLVMGTDPAGTTVALNGVDITSDVHSPDVSAQVSKVATIQTVRDILSAQMRAIVAREGRIVVEGRDITTVVCPDADVRVLLVADPAARMARRNAQMGGVLDAGALVDQVVSRDKADATMSAFETPAPGVSLIDSTDLTLEQVVDAVVALVPEGRGV